MTSTAYHCVVCDAVETLAFVPDCCSSCGGRLIPEPASAEPNLDEGLGALRDVAAAAEACRILVRAYRHDHEDVDWNDVGAALSRALVAFGLPADDLGALRGAPQGGPPVTRPDAYLINPVAATVSPVRLAAGEGRLGAIRALIGPQCSLVEAVDLGADHFAYIDEEGLLRPAAALWRGRTPNAAPLAGRALLLRRGPEGESLPPTIPIETVARSIRAYRPEIVTDLIDVEPIRTLATTIITGAALGAFRLVLTEAPFTVAGS